MRIILSIVLFVWCFTFIATKNVCRLPKQWKTQYDFNYKKRPSEWSTTNSKTDYYKLVFSWSPTFCKHLPAAQRTSNFQCQHDDFGLIVHGLWAQSRSAKTLQQQPRNCRDEKQLPLPIIKRHFCTMPGEYLIQSEWEKHGTCAFRTAEEYLDTIEKLVSRLNFPEMKPLLRDPRVDQYKIKRAILEKNPRLRANQLQVYMKSKELMDVKICFDLKLNYTNCYR